MPVCIWCQQDKSENEFTKKVKHCKKCHNEKYKTKIRSYEQVECPNCKQKRQMRTDAYKKRKSDLCQKCSPLKNPHIFKSEHGLDTTHPLYKRWWCMKIRISRDENSKWYKDKGIVVCDDWLDYKNFYDWGISSGFSPELELDRINSDENYCPTNCRWITHRENCKNAVRQKKAKLNSTLN